MTGPTLRLDKWLWHARLCKTRSLAGRLCTAGAVELAGTVAQRPAQPVRIGDRLYGLPWRLAPAHRNPRARRAARSGARGQAALSRDGRAGPARRYRPGREALLGKDGEGEN
ncbi:MAG: S4 domain-containing protein [Aliidongia sp.]